MNIFKYPCRGLPPNLHLNPTPETSMESSITHDAVDSNNRLTLEIKSVFTVCFHTFPPFSNIILPLLICLFLLKRIGLEQKIT